MIVTADLHMDKVGDSIMIDGEPSQIVDIRTRMNELYDAAKNDDKSIVIAGDIFNKVNPPSKSISDFIHWLDRCQCSGISVFIIPGNHDSGTDWVNLAMLGGVESLANVTVIEDVNCLDIVPVGDVVFVPHLPYRYQERIDERGMTLAEYVKSRSKEDLSDTIVIGHGQITGLDYSNDIFFEAGNAMEFDANAFAPFGLMILGHVHEHMVIDSDAGTVITPGSPRITNFGEVSEDKGYLVVHSPTDWKWVDFVSEVTPFVDLTIDLVSKDEVDLSPKRVQAVAQDAVIKIRVHARDRVQVDEAAIRKAFNAFGRVTRFETHIGSKIVETSDRSKVKERSHSDNLREWLKKSEASAAVKKRAQAMGEEIIAEVMDAE